MKQRYEELSHALCVRAVLEAFRGKWRRRDVMAAIQKYSGISRKEFEAASQNGDCGIKVEAAEAVAYEVEERLENLFSGDADALELAEVKVRQRKDGMTGKLREIAELDVFHQIFGHLVKLGIEPTLKARITPWQHASIPRRGPLRLKKQLERNLRRKSLDIRAAVKVDVRHAYGSLQYERVIALLRQEIPRGKWILELLAALARAAPEGHLIIGGYLDAWLFNFAMSYGLRYAMGLNRQRRGRRVPLVARPGCYMDDVVFLGRRKADLKSAARSFGRWIWAHLGLRLKEGLGFVAFLTAAQERARGRAATPGGRGCPGLDMGGYVVHRTYTTIRGRIYLRARRAFLRCRHLEIQAARRVCSYYGYLVHTDSRRARERLDALRVREKAAALCAAA